jgi:hypothetical protein
MSDFLILINGNAKVFSSLCINLVFLANLEAIEAFNLIMNGAKSLKAMVVN